MSNYHAGFPTGLSVMLEKVVNGKWRVGRVLDRSKRLETQWTAQAQERPNAAPLFCGVAALGSRGLGRHMSWCVWGNNILVPMMNLRDA